MGVLSKINEPPVERVGEAILAALRLGGCRVDDKEALIEGAVALANARFGLKSLRVKVARTD